MTNEEILKQMDAAAELARDELAKLVVKYPEAAGAFSEWMKINYSKAGYKRLAKQIIALAK